MPFIAVSLVLMPNLDQSCRCKVAVLVSLSRTRKYIAHAMNSPERVDGRSPGLAVRCRWDASYAARREYERLPAIVTHALYSIRPCTTNLVKLFQIYSWVPSHFAILLDFSAMTYCATAELTSTIEGLVALLTDAVTSAAMGPGPTAETSARSGYHETARRTTEANADMIADGRKHDLLLDYLTYVWSTSTDLER